MVSQSEVRSLFNYKKDSGELIWIKKSSLFSNVPVGSAAGYKMSDGYLSVKINGRLYLHHRIIWLWMYGYFPEGDIDHIDRDRSNNRLNNLREVSRQCNIRNSKVGKLNNTGVKGVRWFGRDNKWRAYIKVNNVSIWLGDFLDFSEAVAHRLAAEQCLGWDGCDSTSSAFLFIRRR